MWPMASMYADVGGEEAARVSRSRFDLFIAKMDTSAPKTVDDNTN
jgi:hypothetical protein